MKPLIALYAERFWDDDRKTGKSKIDKRKLKRLKSKLVPISINEDFYRALVSQIKKPWIPIMRSRSHLKEIKAPPNTQGNIYYNKKLILQKIIIILEGYKNW